MIIGIKKIINNIDTSKLNQKEVAVIQKYGSEKRRLESFNSLFILDQMLKERNIFSYEVKREFSGKPYIANTNLYHNMSHAGTYASCVIYEEIVGIDIEQITPRINKIAKRFLSPSDLVRYEKKELKEVELTIYWTIKEAFTKLSGRGLTIPFNEIEIEKEDSHYIASYKREKGYIKTFIVEDYIISVSAYNKFKEEPRIKFY